MAYKQLRFPGMPKPVRGLIKKGVTDSHKYILHACVDCGKERWATLRRRQVRSIRCRSCGAKRNFNNAWRARGKNHNTWKGGRTINSKGYVLIWLPPDDFYYPMVDKNSYVMEHRLVMARSLGRCLQSWEFVHHKGIRYRGIENKQDNLLDNLEMTTNGSHMIAHQKGYKDGHAKGMQDGRNKQIQELKVEIRLLRWELKERGRVL